VRLRLSPRVSYTRSKSVPVDTRKIPVYRTQHHSTIWASSWCNSLNVGQTSCRLPRHVRPASCVLYGSFPSIGNKRKVSSDLTC
jgi:hypothetical protein